MALPFSQRHSAAPFSCTLQLCASRFLALGRTSLWWCTPAWGTSGEQVHQGRTCGSSAAAHTSRCKPTWVQLIPSYVTRLTSAAATTTPHVCPQVPEETQFLLLELAGGRGGYALLLPLIDGGAFRATLRGGCACWLPISLCSARASGWPAARQVQYMPTWLVATKSLHQPLSLPRTVQLRRRHAAPAH